MFERAAAAFRVAAFFMSAVFFAGAAEAVQYSADSVIETAEGAIASKVYVGENMERRDMEMDGETVINIVRRDLGVIWMVMPNEELYMESKLAPGADSGSEDMNDYVIEESADVGEEEIDGVLATKSKIIMSHKTKKEKLGGFFWRTADGIAVKVDAIAVDKNSKERFKLELSGLERGPQDPKLFAVPRQFEKMPSMPGMMGMPGMHRH